LAAIVIIWRLVLPKEREGYLLSKECKFDLEWAEFLAKEDFQALEKHNSHLIINCHH
jgi:hypothetical protein